MSLLIAPEDFDALLARIRDAGVRIIMPDDPDRAVVVDLLMLMKVGIAPGWSRSDTADGVSVTLPVLPDPIPALLDLAGVALTPFTTLGADGARALARLTRTPTICLAPRVVATRDVWTVMHERQHLYQTREGGLIHELRYVASTEYRTLAAEGPAMACDLARAVWHEGAEAEAAVARLAGSLRAYGADDVLVRDVTAQLAFHAGVLAQGLCPPALSLLEGVRFLRARGVAGLPEVPAG